MPHTYDLATKAVYDLAEEIMEAHHKPLAQAGVTLDILWHLGDPLCHAGYGAYAVIKITSLKERVAGRRDAEIVIDKDKWDKLPDETRKALLDHEITHLIVVQNGNDVMYDDHHRPRLCMRKHDFQVGWFHEMPARYGAACIEAIQAQKFFHSTAGKVYLEGEAGDEPEPEPAEQEQEQ